jgi:phage shock protein PspC (stress-responsive transcriptional regulator)
MIGGVCGGLGKATPVPAWMWRAIFLLCLLSFGFGLIPYIVLWIAMPREKPVSAEEKPVKREDEKSGND